MSSPSHEVSRVKECGGTVASELNGTAKFAPEIIWGKNRSHIFTVPKLKSRFKIYSLKYISVSLSKKFLKKGPLTI